MIFFIDKFYNWKNVANIEGDIPIATLLQTNYMGSLLKLKKLNETPFRKEVIDIFAKFENAIPLSIIEKELKEYDRITLYRTIKIFLEKGIIHEIAIGGQASSYAMCKDECGTVGHHNQHIHFKCTKCDTVFCVEIDNTPEIKLPGFKIDDVEIQATGLCKKCNS